MKQTPTQIEFRARQENGETRNDFVEGYRPGLNLTGPVRFQRGAPALRIWNHMAYANVKGLAELTGLNASTISKKTKSRGIQTSRIKFPFGTGKGNNYYALTPEFLDKMNIDPALVTNWRRENDPKFREPSNV